MTTKLVNFSDVLDSLPKERRQEIDELAEELLLESGLAAMREELEISQRDLAKALGVSQPAVAQIEQRGNELKLSTLKRYVETMGGKLSLAVQMPTGHSHIFRI